MKRSFATVSSIINMLPFCQEHYANYSPFSKERMRLHLLRELFVSGGDLANAVVMSSAHAIEVLERFGAPIRDESFVAPNPIPPFVRYDPARPPPHPYGGKGYVFYLSVVVWYENHVSLIEGYRRAVAWGEDLPDLLFAGPPADPAYLERMEQAIAAGGLQHRVRYLGFVDRQTIPGWLGHARA